MFFSILFKAQAQFTDQINSNRPGKSMMAYAVGKTIIQAETGLNYINEEHNLMQYKAKGFIGDLALRWGLFKEELELLAEFQYQKTLILPLIILNQEVQLDKLYLALST